MTDETNAAPAGAGEDTAISQATAVERIMAMDAPEPAQEEVKPEATEQAAAEPEVKAESTEGEKPATDKAEPEPETELQLKGDAKTRLRDGREVSISDLKRRFEKADEFEAELTKARERDVQVQQNAQKQQLLEQHLPAILHQLQANMPKPPDIALADSDPIEFAIQKAKYDQRVTELQAVEAAQRDQTQKAQQAEQQRLQGYLKEQNELILEKIPELKDPEKAKQFKEKYEKAAAHYGFSPQEAQQVYDHRLVVMINDAMQYRALQAEKAAAVEKAKAPTNSAPMSPQRRVASSETATASLNEAYARARKSGRMEDAVSAIALLG